MTAFEPLTGRRVAEIRETGTGQDYAGFMNRLSGVYPGTEKPAAVQDNLDTHTPGSFYAAFDPEKASELTRMSGFHCTPTKAGRLNTAETGLSAIAAEYFSRRIPDIETLRHEVQTCVRERNRQKAAVRWRFTKNDARKKMKRHYPITQN